MKTLFTLLFILSSLLFAPRVFAHSADHSYLYLRIYDDRIEGTVEITTGDLRKGAGVALESGLTIEDLEPVLQRLYAYVRKHLKISSSQGAHSLDFTEPSILEAKAYGDFVQFNFELGNIPPIPDELDIDFDVLLDVDSKHRCMVLVGENWKAGIINNESRPSLLFSPGDSNQTLSLVKGSKWTGFVAMVKLGMWHIWIGLDHILFLLALVLPSVVRRRQDLVAQVRMFRPQTWNVWEPVSAFRPAFWYIVKIVTFFTIAHSLTLSAAGLGWINLPSRFVESIIALSIALAAYHNIRPIFKSREWIIAFGFGLFHGFGFASVLGDKGLSGDYLVLSLLGFNVGVEIGQVAIICAIFPVLYLLRNLKSYPRILGYTSILLILIALYWFVERSLDINFMLDDHIGNAVGRVMAMVSK